MDEEKRNNFRKSIIYEKSSVEKLIENLKKGNLNSEISDEDFYGAVEWYTQEIIKDRKKAAILKKKIEDLKKKNNK